MHDHANSVPNTRAGFGTTSWSRVIGATGYGTAARQELALLIRDYWHPLYAYLRRTGLSPHDAEDCVQAFLAWMLEKDILARANPERGRFRNFLIVSLKQFIARQHKYETATKRQPAKQIVSLNVDEGELHYQQLPVNTVTPDEMFERAWAVSLIKQTMDRLRREMEESGHLDRFDCLQGALSGQTTMSGRQAAEKLGMSESAVRVTVHRMKRRYGELLRDEVAMTLDHGEDVDAELLTR